MNPRSRLLVLLAIWPIAAHAYVDPGSGMLLIQGLIALIGGIIVFVKHPVRTAKELWAKLFRRFN